MAIQTVEAHALKHATATPDIDFIAYGGAFCFDLICFGSSQVAYESTWLTTCFMTWFL
jgi:hypothetical protein